MVFVQQPSLAFLGQDATTLEGNLVGEDPGEDAVAMEAPPAFEAMAETSAEARPEYEPPAPGRGATGSSSVDHTTDDVGTSTDLQGSALAALNAKRRRLAHSFLREHPLGSMLLDWQHKNSMVPASLPELAQPQEAADSEIGACLKTGVCKHTGRGRQVIQLRQRIHKQLKLRFPTRTEPDKKKLLQEGWGGAVLTFF